MPRPTRFEYEGAFHHVMNRGRNRETIFHGGRYIELNPVRAKMVEQPSDYTWSSYHHNADSKRIKLIIEHPIYLTLGSSIEIRNRRYKALFDSVISNEKMKDIRSALGRSWVLGSEEFKAKLENESGLEIVLNRWGGVRRAR